MKIYIILLLLALLSSCSSSKKSVSTFSKLDNSIALESECPIDGKCTIKIIKNKALNVQTDQFGSVYTQQLESPETSIIVFQYDRNVPKDLQDAHYREEIVFQVNNASPNLTLKDKEIQITKMLFGRFCFCRGQTGYYRVENGILNLNQVEDKINMSLSFKVDQVPQKIEVINAIIQ
jgi:hypothetical protein